MKSTAETPRNSLILSKCLESTASRKGLLRVSQKVEKL